MDFVFVPPGTFLMGSPEDEKHRMGNEVQHRVTLTPGFWLGIYPVTQSQWQAVMGCNPSRFQGEDRPVERVSWDDCQDFCSKLIELTGQSFALPTEALWEYACRAGTTTAYYTGDWMETLKRVCWYASWTPSDSILGTKPAGQFEPNAWGLFDMHGNVFEWCRNLFSDVGPAERASRGGSWVVYPWYCRSAFRACDEPGCRDDTLGFRVLMCPDD